MSEDRGLWRRRDALARLGWLGVFGWLLASGGAFARLLYRRAPVEPPSVFSAGRPGDFAKGVDDRFLAEWRVFIVREDDRLFALFARCTHLGCTPRWVKRNHQFKCPCHGSGFHADGVNFEGPAPRPLERARVWLDPDGELLVDVARRFREDQWDEPGACLTAEELGAA